MEKVFLESGVLGAGILACGGFVIWLVKYMLTENKSDKERHCQEIKDLQEMYKFELSEDRKVYVESMNKVVGKLDTLEKDVEVIKNKLA